LLASDVATGESPGGAPGATSADVVDRCVDELEGCISARICSNSVDADRDEPCDDVDPDDRPVAAEERWRLDNRGTP
jgi:hypothetical protein